MIFASMLKRSAALCLSFTLVACANGSVQTEGQSSPSAETASPAENVGSDPRVGQLEPIAELTITPGNVAVSQTGRIFASVHGLRRGEAQMIEIFPGEDRWQPFPDEEWNAAPGSGENVLNTPHGVLIDGQDRLWVIDHGNWMPEEQAVAPAKLLAFDINTGEVTFRMDFDATAAPEGQLLQDLAVDEERGFVYMADSGKAGILVVDINNRQTWRWDDHPSLQPEDIDVVVEGNAVGFSNPDGSVTPARIAINPITLSADGETVFYGAMTGRKWYSIPAELLRTQATDSELAEAVAIVGDKPVSDGASTDAEGNHFITNLGENAIDVLNAEGELTQLVQDERLLWPDNLRFGAESWLYISVNQLHRAAAFDSEGVDQGEPPYQIFRVWTGTQGQPGR